MSCTYCGEELNRSQRRVLNGRRYKSCPSCSTQNGSEHVYYSYPESFGETLLRASSNDPDGAQSYCIICRGNGTATGGVLCQDTISESM